MNYELPKSVEIDGISYPIRSDYRAILDIISAVNDPNLTDRDKAVAMLEIFYEEIPQNTEEALKKVGWFIDCGAETENNRPAPKRMDWDKDFQYIVAPVNRVIGQEIRAMDYLHWWTFVSAYYEIGGDCTFAQIVSIRDKIARHKKLSDAERDWYRHNRDIVDIKTHYSDAQEEIIRQWTGKA